MCKQRFTIYIRRKNKLFILLTFTACLSVSFISKINSQMHPEWLNLIAAILHEVLHAYTDLPACVILGPIRGQRRIYEEQRTKFSHALFSRTEIIHAC
jgi:hypothetical protein